MEFPSVPMTSASAPAAPSAGTPARLGEGPKSSASSGSGKSFSSVLHSVSDQQRQDMRATSDGDSKAPADQAPSSTSTNASTGRDNADTDRPVGTDQRNEKPVAAVTTPEPATQAILLALGTTPVAEPAPQPVADASSSAATAVSGQETTHPVMPVSPEETVTPAALPQKGESGQTVPATGETAAAPIAPQVAATLPMTNTATDQALPSQDAQMTDRPQAEEIPTAQESRAARKTEQKDSLLKDEHTAAPLASVSRAEAQPVTPEKAPAVVSQQQARIGESEPVQPIREQDRPVTQLQPEPSPESVQAEKEPASHGPAVTPAAWQSFSDEQQAQGGPDLSNRERRDRQGEELVPVGAGSAPASAPASGSYADMSSGMADSKPAPPPMPATPAHGASQTAMPHAMQATDWTPEQASTQSRSVVLEVAQADLGRVNIRVAVNQDLVHAYFTSDRAEVGQFLANGQDKLQAALQNSGLDMGQFRVDIDRQSAGRSFQQQTPHNPYYGYTSQGEGDARGPAESAVARQAHRQGMLNVVA